MDRTVARVRPRSRFLRAGVCIVVAALVAAGVWQAEDAGWFDARATAVSDETAHSMLADVTRWDAATSGERRGVAERVAKGLSGFALLRVRRFGEGDGRHEVAVFRQEATGLEFSLVPGGTFRMGSPPDEEERVGDEGPQHEVTLSKPFLLCRTECTQTAYERVTGANPSGVKGPDHPVETVSWDDATAFCGKTGLRLPTEAEWEWACRAGTTTRFWSGDGEADLARVGWYRENPDSMHPWMRRVLDWLGRPAPQAGHRPVAAKAANPFGLHDVHGNVWEWCADAYGPYQSGSVTDPTGPEAAEYRVLRGGAFFSSASGARSAYRSRLAPVFQKPLIGVRLGDTVGFRPARSVTSE